MSGPSRCRLTCVGDAELGLWHLDKLWASAEACWRCGTREAVEATARVSAWPSLDQDARVSAWPSSPSVGISRLYMAKGGEGGEGGKGRHQAAPPRSFQGQQAASPLLRHSQLPGPAGRTSTSNAPLNAVLHWGQAIRYQALACRARLSEST